MSAISSPGPAFTKVQLAGSAAEVARLMVLLSGGAEVIYDSRSVPDARGEITCEAHVVTHPVARPPALEQVVSVTVQAVLEAESDAFPGLPGTAAAQKVEESVAAVLASLPGIRHASSRVISAWGLPALRE